MVSFHSFTSLLWFHREVAEGRPMSAFLKHWLFPDRETSITLGIKSAGSKTRKG